MLNGGLEVQAGRWCIVSAEQMCLARAGEDDTECPGGALQQCKCEVEAYCLAVEHPCGQPLQRVAAALDAVVLACAYERTGVPSLHGSAAGMVAM